MKNEKISLKEWQKKYLAGEFTSKDVKTQIDAGWYDWFCEDSALLSHTEKLAAILMKITNKTLLNDYYVYFKNCFPLWGPLYDRIGFSRIEKEDEGDFVLCIGDKRDLFRYNIYSDWHGWDMPCFMSSYIKDILKYMNNEKGFPPKVDI